MRLFFISSTKQLVVENEDLEEYLQYARKKELIIIDSDGKVSLSPEGKELVEWSYYSTLHASYWMRILFNEKTIMITTAIFLIILSLLKILVGYQLASQGMISEGFENLTDLIKIGIVALLGFKLNKDKIASIIIIGLMLFTGISLIVSGVNNLLNPTVITPTVQAYLICFISIAINAGLMFLKSFIGRISGNLSLMSDSKDSGLNVKISAGVAIGLTFAIFKIYFVDAIIGIIIAVLVFKEGVELLRELFTKEEDFDITAIKVLADNIYDDRLTGYILGSIRREDITNDKLVKNFEYGLHLGRLYYGGFADFFYADLGSSIINKHINKLIENNIIETLKEHLTLTAKGMQLYYKAKAKEFKERAQSVYTGPFIPRGCIYCILILISLICLIMFANEINEWLLSF
ncbi:MAG: cation diffusion facilitator family transporter [Candidatus Hermodarchaeota archaeon]